MREEVHMRRGIVAVFCTLVMTTMAFPVLTVGRPLSNNPPEIPMIMGPTNGSVGLSYDYLVSSWDPDSDDVFYWVEWGDGTHDGWLGPCPSGEHLMVNHSWSERGSYAITAKAKDINGAESNFSAPLIMNVTGPQMDIIIHPHGFGVAATLVNMGEEAATNVTWAITLDGGFVFFGAEKEGKVERILPNETLVVTSLFFGLFKVLISATADDGSDNLSGLIVGPLLFPAVKIETFNGTIKKLDRAGKEVEVQNEKTSLKGFKISNTCKFKDRNGDAITINDIREGMKVKVTWMRSNGTAGNSERVAIEIQVCE
jgi:hypothetical protein